MYRKFLFLFLALLPAFSGMTQRNYGLAFNSFNVSQEARTSLEIGKKKHLCFSDNIDLSFDFYFIPDREVYFGYIFRLINDEKQNIDLLYNQKDLVFNTVVGGTFGNINFTIDSSRLYSAWTTIRYHFSKNALSCYINEKLYKTVNINLKNRCFRLLFGANNYPEFATTDVPSMVIRNISIKNDNRLVYFWPLNNAYAGTNEIADSISHEKADVCNPVWQATAHANWKMLRSMNVKGDASIAYDKLSETLYITADDSVYKLPANDRMSSLFRMPSFGYHLYQGNQSVYNSSDNSLYNFYIDKKEITRFIPAASIWDKKFDSVPNTEYGHTNRIYVPEENALYVFGGYGQMKYKNEVQRYDFSTKQWNDVEAKGDYFTPRYMAAAGKSGNHIYIIGGYGSHTGDQLLNPGYLYDLMDYDIKARTFRKVYSLPEPDSTFVFAGSMYVDSSNHCFYALCFDRSKYDTKLHLIRGSLEHAEYEIIGNDIPYAFHDVVSDADLFYSARSRQLIAVTQLVDLGNSTTIKIYGIAFPPENLSPVIAKTFRLRYYVYVLLVILLVCMLYILYRKRNKRQPMHVKGADVIEDRKQVREPAIKAAEYNNVVFTGLSDKTLADKPDFILDREDPVTVHLFGSFEMIDEQGNDVSGQFSPLLKELFLVILLNTLKTGKGITSEKLNEIFWENKTGKNAKNNLSVNIVRLKSILNKVGKIHIVKNGEHWECEFDNKKVSIDLADYLQLRAAYASEHGKAYLSKMLYFISRGAFLKQMECAWLDNIKTDINNKIIDDLTDEMAYLDMQQDAEYIIEVANCVFNFDLLNEDALHYKCKVLDKLGRHSIAKSTYERFVKDYKKSYGEDFSIPFSDIIK